MQDLLYVVVRLARTMIWALEIAMLVRAVLSWFPDLSESRFGDFIWALTEPFIVPVRALLDRLGWGSGMPFDIAFMITYFLLILISTVLEHFV